MAYDLTETNEYGDEWWMLRHTGRTWAGQTRWLVFDTLEGAMERIAKLNADPKRRPEEMIVMELASTYEWPVRPDVLVLYRGRTRQRGSFR